MRPLVWSFIEWHVGRRLPLDQRVTTLGDLAEDFNKHMRRRGRWRAEFWLVRETLALGAAYRSPFAFDPQPERSVMSLLRFDETRHAIRRLLKSPGASAASVLTLGCALAAAAVTWTLLSAILLSPLPVDRPEELQVVGFQAPERNGVAGRLSASHVYRTYQDIHDSQAFPHLAAGGRYSLMVGEGERPQSRNAYFASHNFFDLLGVRIARGRGFQPTDDQRDAPLTVILSDRYWHSHYQRADDVLGRQITVGGIPATIVGVTPRAFRGLTLTDAPDFYMPLQTLRMLVHPDMNYFMDGSSQSSPTSWLTLIARVEPGAPPELFQSRLTELREVINGFRLRLTPLAMAALPEQVRPGIEQFTRLLGATVGLLLLIGSLTVGMLLLVRTETRRDELAMCMALGAPRHRLAAGIAIEGLLLSLTGIAVAIPMSIWLFAAVARFQLPGGVQIELLNLSVDAPALLATVLAAVAVTTVIAVVAGVFGFGADIAEVLRARAGATPRLARRRTRTVLVAAQVAITLVLLTGAGLFARSLMSALDLNPGFDTARLLETQIGLDRYGYSSAQAGDFVTTLHQRLLGSPVFSSVSLSLWDGAMTSAGFLVVDGQRRQFPSTVAYLRVDDRYFATLGLPIIRGRNFEPSDFVQNSLAVIVSESFGRQLAFGGDPVGHTIQENRSRMGEPRDNVRIVGVVPDVVTNVAALEPLVIYYPLAADLRPIRRQILARASTDASIASAKMLSTIRELDVQITPSPVLTMRERISRQMAPQQFGISILGALSVIAVLLTALGTYVLAETMAAVRRREMGIRAALGASRRELGGLILRETTRLIAVGLIAGLGLAWVGAGLIQSFLFQVQPFDPVTIGVVVAAILLIALAVSLRPAIAAGRVDLTRLLREE